MGRIPDSIWKNSTSWTDFPTPLSEKSMMDMADAHFKSQKPVVGVCSPRSWIAYLKWKLKNSQSD